MAKKTYTLILNVEVEEDQRPERKEYYYQFKGWKHGIISKENEISFEGKNISVPYSRWSNRELQELGEVIHKAVAEMIKQEK